MNPIRIAILGAAGSILLAGCSGESGSSAAAPEPQPTNLPELPIAEGALRAKPSYENARQLSDSVKVGMPQSMVEAMFGPPDKAGYKVYGRATKTPWRALVWEWVFQDARQPHALSVVFQADAQGAWRVHHGDWPQ